jgi:hypothetical protein
LKYRWVEKNVDLNLLADGIEKFFERSGLKDVSKSYSDGYVISGIFTVGDLCRRITVEVFGSPKDFSIFLQYSDESTTAKNILFDSLITLFGGAAFISRRLKLRDFLERFEKDFWIFTDELVAKLSFSGK